MKNKESMQKIYKRRKIAFVTILAIVLLCLIISLLNKNKLRKIAQEGSMLKLGAQEVDISNITSNEPNVPVVGAGMIPIKWNSSINMWQITTTSDKEWYNYEEGNYANVMLSDGYYKSELQVGTTKEQLAENNVGVGIPNDPEHMGTIFTWIPRFAYLEDDVKFLKNNSILEYEWTTESCFNLEGYGANSLDLAFTGIWVGEKEYSSATELQNKNSKMNEEDNIEGLISNEKIFSITQSEKTAIQKLTEKYANTNTEILKEIDKIQNRQVIKIVNTNSRIPIVGMYTLLEEEIKVDAKYSENTINFVADKNGNKLSGGITPLSEDETQYTFYIVDNIGNIRKYKVNYGSGKPNIKSFNKNITFYVTYDDETGEETSYIPIGEQEPENWYNYEEQKWANIVVRDEGKENYFVWIPRYMYKIKSAEDQTIDAKFVDLDNVWIDETGKEINLDEAGYKLPEAFTWEDPEDPNNKIQLTGFWANKYKLRAEELKSPEIFGREDSIIVNNIASYVGDSSKQYTYEMYLIKDGKILGDNYVENRDARPIELTGDYTFTNVPAGKYGINIVVKNEGQYVTSVTKEVTVEKSKIEPDLTQFNPCVTFYVTYDDETGEETSYIPIGEQPPENWYNYDEQKWANIVVRDEGTESYFVWIPKYEYRISLSDETAQKTNVKFIGKDQAKADPGYKIPEAFTWTITKEDGAEETVQLSGFWASKYKLRDIEIVPPNIVATENSIIVKDIQKYVANSNYTYEMYLIRDGKILGNNYVENRNAAPINLTGDYTFENVPEGKYGVNIVVKDSNQKYVTSVSRGIIVEKLKIEPDLSGFNPNLTYYVTYDDVTGYETSYTPIGEQAPENWYSYSEQKWANVVVRENGKENYFVWIPRYEYRLADNEKTSVKFIGTEQTEADPGYKIPEAFTWKMTNEDETETTVQLSGFWASKYKLRDSKSYSLDAAITVGKDKNGGYKIRVSDIAQVSDTTSSGIFFEATLLQEGKKIQEQPIIGTTGECIFKVNEPGTYAVLVRQWNAMNSTVSAVAKEVEVQEQGGVPDLTGFNEEKTYIVTYNDDGTENIQKISGILKEDGTIDESKITIGVWYDYAEQKWANIVVKDNIDGVETENYFVWIPRYEYTAVSGIEKAEIVFITRDQIEPDEGYKIPEAFTWTKTTEKGEEQVQLSGFWASKYKLRK